MKTLVYKSLGKLMVKPTLISQTSQQPKQSGAVSLLYHNSLYHFTENDKNAERK